MISAFGVEHTMSKSEIIKSWKKLAPKLTAASEKITVQGSGRGSAGHKHLYIAQRRALNEANSQQAKFIHDRIARKAREKPKPVGMRGPIAEPAPPFKKWKRLR
jgi:hypothetical protein